LLFNYPVLYLGCELITGVRKMSIIAWLSLEDTENIIISDSNEAKPLAIEWRIFVDATFDGMDLKMRHEWAKKLRCFAEGLEK